MVVWQGITEGGTAVPVQVTEEGRVVAEGQEGKEGPPGPPGPPGPQGEYGPGDDVELGSGTFAGSVSSPTVESGFDNGNKDGVQLVGTGYLNIRNETATANVFSIYNGVTSDANRTIGFTKEGSATFASAGLFANSGSWENDGEPGIRLDAYSNYSTLSVKNPSTYASAAFQVLSDGYGLSNVQIELKNDGSSTFAGNKCGFTAAGELYFTSRGTRYKLFVAQGLVQAEEYTREMQLREKAEAIRAPRPADNLEND